VICWLHSALKPSLGPLFYLTTVSPTVIIPKLLNLLLFQNTFLPEPFSISVPFCTWGFMLPKVAPICTFL
jgi:hypothetical protein